MTSSEASDEDIAIDVEETESPSPPRGRGKSLRVNLSTSPGHRRTASGGKYGQYDFHNVIQAYNAVKKDKMTIREASEKYGIPQTTLRDRVTGRVCFSRHKT